VWDLANTLVRTQLATVHGASRLTRFGGKQRQVQVDLDPNAPARQRGCPPTMWSRPSVSRSRLAGGTQRLARWNTSSKLNSSPEKLDDLNNMPIRAQKRHSHVRPGRRDVRDGYSPQTNMSGSRGIGPILMSVLKTGAASTIEYHQQHQ